MINECFLQHFYFSFIYLFIYLFIYKCIYLFIYFLFIYLFIYFLFIYLFNYLTIYLFIYLFCCSESIQFLIPYYFSLLLFHFTNTLPWLIKASAVSFTPTPFCYLQSLLNRVSEVTIGTLLLTVQYLCYLGDTMLHQWSPDSSKPLSREVDRAYLQG